MKSNRNILTVIVLVAMALSACFMFCLYGFDNDTIFASAYCCDDRFHYEIKHKRIVATGATYTFKPYQSKDELFGNLKKTFEVFQEEDNVIRLIYNAHIYTVKQKSTEENVYDLYSECIVYEKGTEVYYIPFPTGQLSKATNDLPRTSDGYLTIKDFNVEVYRNFYSVYQDVVVTENEIYGKGFSLINEGKNSLRINVAQ